MSKNLVMTRKQINSMYQTKAQLSGIEMMLSSSQMSAEVMESMKGVNAVLGKVNEDMNVQDI